MYLCRAEVSGTSPFLVVLSRLTEFGTANYGLPNCSKRGHHCGVPDVMPRALGGQDVYQSEPEEKKDNAGCKSTWCGPHYDLADRQLHEFGALEERGYCKQDDPHGPCLQPSDHKEKKDNTGCDNFHCIPPHILEGREPHQSNTMGGRKRHCVYGPHGRCLHGSPKEKKDNAGCDNFHCIPPHATVDPELHQVDSLEKRKYCKQYGPRGCIQYDDHKEKRDSIGCDNFHCIPDALGVRGSHESESMEKRKYVCTYYHPNGRCLRGHFG